MSGKEEERKSMSEGERKKESWKRKREYEWRTERGKEREIERCVSREEWRDPLFAEVVAEQREVEAEVGQVRARVRLQQQQAAVERGVQRGERVHVRLAHRAQLAQEELRQRQLHQQVLVYRLTKTQSLHTSKQIL